jgi:CheY-like chemotaxis protein
MAHDIKALVVDDDDHVRTFLVVLLRKIVSGSVFEARNGQEALEVFAREKPELILLDVNMPILDGLQTLAKIRETHPDLPVIMITSLAMRKVVDDALRTGASNFIRKDTPKGQMIEIIRETIVTCLYPESADQQAGASAESAPN